MKKVFTILVILLVGYFAYQFLSGGKLPFGGGSSSPDMEKLSSLRGEFRAAVREYQTALKTASVSGVDTTSSVEAAVAKATRIKKEVQKLLTSTTDNEVKKEGQDLINEIDSFLRKANP